MPIELSLPEKFPLSFSETSFSLPGRTTDGVLGFSRGTKPPGCICIKRGLTRLAEMTPCSCLTLERLRALAIAAQPARLEAPAVPGSGVLSPVHGGRLKMPGLMTAAAARC